MKFKLKLFSSDPAYFHPGRQGRGREVVKGGMVQSPQHSRLRDLHVSLPVLLSPLALYNSSFVCVGDVEIAICHHCVAAAVKINIIGPATHM